MQDILRGTATLFIFVSFILLCFDVYRKSKKAYYDEAALLPFKEKDTLLRGKEEALHDENMAKKDSEGDL